MFEKITPEEAGISSDAVAEYISRLERRGATTHSVLMMKGDRLFAEYYWAPFHRDYCHRQYSVTKSFVAIAIGFLIDEGKLSLDDTAASFFPERIDGPLNPNYARQTIREMLTMSTAGGTMNWFKAGDPDRTHLYFAQERPDRPSGVLWEYDSAGSQVLCSLAEKLAGMPLLDYLKKKIFDEMGTFRTAEILKIACGDSWGDSAMVCTARDLASFARFVLNYGKWNGRQLLSEAYVREATSRLVDNHICGHEEAFSKGYGYQIWRLEQDSFAFNGMGCQFAVCVPKKDLVFVINSDNQGASYFAEAIIDSFFDLIVDPMRDEALRPSAAAQKRLARATGNLKLRAVTGPDDSPFRRELSGKVWHCEPNPMGITKFSFVFRGKGKGEFRYTNAQGDKVLPFGVNRNEFGLFPQLGYSDGVGGQRTTDGFMLKDAVSLAWIGENRLRLNVQIIDRYFGNFCGIFGFRGKEAFARFTANAEDFLEEYAGDLRAKRR